MKKFFIFAIFGIMLCAVAKDLKILMVGNSFSICVGRNLPQLVAHENKHSVEITSAYIGGCLLSRHADNLKEAEKNPDFKPYRIDIWTSKDLRRARNYKGNVNQLLKNNKYDIITIQQGSSESWDYKFYQPYANELIAYIKKYQPQAEIVIQQTWAYRADAPHLKKWKFSNAEMSDMVINAYKEFAAATKLRMIPTGEAVALTRQYSQYKYSVLTAEQLKSYVWPDLPPHSNDVVGKHYWVKDKKEMRLGCDSIHLNEHGEYLQACVWYAFLFGEDAEKITYEAQLSTERCKILRKCAAEAIAKYK